MQSASAIFYLDQNDGHLEIDVMRIGSSSGTCRVRYATADCSAKSGLSYRGTEGEIVFNDQEDLKTFRVEGLSDRIWSPTVEFVVHLSDAENCGSSPSATSSSNGDLEIDKTRMKTIRKSRKTTKHGRELTKSS